ncbi:MAG: hypothetical protein D6758_11285 [Gammaproteobacteria bacterium]|nr:MAG: hypothetical protein D6758_11285 [Gammaproteobacteria bacterium]
MSTPQGLSLEYLPPLRRIFAFLRVSPWLAALAWTALGTLDIVLDPFHRLAPPVIGAVHLLTLGALMSIWIAASVQFSAVMTAVKLPLEGLWLGIWRWGLWSGLALFAGGLFMGKATWVGTAVVLLAMTLLSYSLMMLVLAVRQGAYAELVQAWLGLLLTIFLGWQQSSLHHGQMGWVLLPPDARWTHLHILTAFSAWAGVLIIAVSSRFVPMFFVTPALSDRWRIGLAGLLSGVPVLGLGCALAGRWGALGALVLVSAWAGCLYLWLIDRCLRARRRSVSEPAIEFWRKLWIVALIAAGLTTLSQMIPDRLDQTALGALWLWGVIMGVMLAMLFKIVPFLSYLHLQRAAEGDYQKIRALPGMRVIWPPADQERLLILHLVVCLVLCAVIIQLLPLWVAALSAAMESLWLGRAMARALRLFREASEQL